MNPNDTLEYYNLNADGFAESTQAVDFHEMQDLFLQELPAGASILDLGCGAGRDGKYFLNCGYDVTAVDGSEELCRIASAYMGIPAKQMLFQELDAMEQYDGIWACASILHMKKDELPAMFRRVYRALKPNGVFYTSFKYGNYEGMRNGRYFTDLTEESLQNVLIVAGLGDGPLNQGQSGNLSERDSKEKGNLQIWRTGDVRPDRGNEQWLNIILRKEAH